MPIDFENTDDELLNIACNYFWTMNKWAADQLSKFTDKIRGGVLEHIVEDFYEFSERKKISIRNKLYGHFSKRFIIGMVNANNTRKRLDLGIHAFRLFHKRVPDSLLVIKTTHFEKSRSYHDWNLFTNGLPVLIFDNHCSDTELNEFYNSFDLMINPTDGEGFGLTPFEAALSGTLSILPLHTSFLALLPHDNSRFCLDVEFVPCAYARSTIDYQTYRAGGDKLSFVCGSRDGTIKDETISTEIPDIHAPNNYLFSLKNANSNFKIFDLTFCEKVQIFDAKLILSEAKNLNSMEEIVDLITVENPTTFQIFITTDIESLRFFLSWSQKNDLIEHLGKHYSIRRTKLEEINVYIGEDRPRVGIIDPEKMCNKMYYYYLNPEDKYNDSMKLQQHVKEKFNSKRIFGQMSNLFKELR